MCAVRGRRAGGGSPITPWPIGVGAGGPRRQARLLVSGREKRDASASPILSGGARWRPARRDAAVRTASSQPFADGKPFRLNADCRRTSDWKATIAAAGRPTVLFESPPPGGPATSPTTPQRRAADVATAPTILFSLDRVREPKTSATTLGRGSAERAGSPERKSPQLAISTSRLRDRPGRRSSYRRRPCICSIYLRVGEKTSR